MPTQALLKATLLKETYGPLVELDGTSKKNHAAASVFPSRLSGLERQFLDLIAPQLFSIKELQEHRRSARLERPGLKVKDLVDRYERLVTACGHNKSTKRYTKVAPLDEDFEFSTTQLHQKVSTPKRHPPNILSDDLDADRAAEKPISSPEETLKNCRNAILETVMAKLDDEEETWPVSNWDAEEHLSGIQMPLVSIRMRQSQVAVQLEKSGSTDGARTSFSGTASSSPSMLATIGVETIGKLAERNMSDTGADTVLATVIQRTVEENGRGETANFADLLQQARKGAMEEDVGEKPLPENSNARLSSSQSMPHFHHDRSSVSFMELLVEGENLEGGRRNNSRRGNFHQGLVPQRGESSVDEVDATLQTTKGDGRGKSLLNTVRSSREFDCLAGQHLHNKRSHNFAVDALARRVNNTTEGCTLGRLIVDAKEALNSSERAEVSENPSAKSHGDNHRQSSLERFSNFFGKTRSMKASTRFTDAKRDFSRGCPEVSHVVENSAAKSHSDSPHRLLDRLSTTLGKSRSLKDSAVFRTDFSKSGPSEVSNRNQINAAAANSHRDTISFLERSSERFRRSQSTKERECPAAGHNNLNSSPSTTLSTISSAMPTIASKTVAQKIQGLLGRSTSLRVTHIQPIAERDEAKSTHQSQERNASSNLPWHGNNNELSSRQLDGNNALRARCGTRSAESSLQEEDQRISSLIADDRIQESKVVKKTDSFGTFPLLSPLARRLNSILGRVRCKVRDASDTKVGKAPGWSAWSVSYTDGLSPPKKSSAKRGVSFKQASDRSPRSSSTRKMMSKRMPLRGYPVSAKRTPPRGYPVSPKRVFVRISPKQSGGHAARHTRKPAEPVTSDGFNKRRLPNRSGPTASQVHPTGYTEELTSSGVSRAAATNVQMELTDMGYSGARNVTSTEQGRVAGRHGTGSKVWAHPIPGYHRRRPTSSSRFQREHIAIHTNSTIACEN